MRCEPMNASLTRLLVCWALTTISVALLCIGIPWFFFLGLALCLASLLFSSRPRTRRWKFIGWLGSLAAAVFLVWFSSYGREPLQWVPAVAVWFSVIVTELEWWRISRRAIHDA